MGIIKILRKHKQEKLWEALCEEAQRIEAELEDDPLLDSLEPPKELYDKIVQELKEKGIWKDE